MPQTMSKAPPSALMLNRALISMVKLLSGSFGP